MVARIGRGTMREQNDTFSASCSMLEVNYSHSLAFTLVIHIVFSTRFQYRMLFKGNYPTVTVITR